MMIFRKQQSHLTPGSWMRSTKFRVTKVKVKSQGKVVRLSAEGGRAVRKLRTNAGAPREWAV